MGKLWAVFPSFLCLCLVGLFGSSCSTVRSFLKFDSSGEGDVRVGKTVFEQHESQGDFHFVKEVGKGEKDHLIVVKSKLFSSKKEIDSQLLESAVVLSRASSLRVGENKIPILKPQISQYTVWLDGKKYLSQIHFDTKEKQIKVVSFNFDKEEYQHKNIDIPSLTGIYCFYSQLEECIRYTGFLASSQKKRSGSINLQLLWDPYPYVRDQYRQMEDSVLTSAVFSYDGETDEGLSSYSLNFLDQAIFFQFNHEGELVKKVWTAQGITLEKESGVMENPIHE